MNRIFRATTAVLAILTLLAARGRAESPVQSAHPMIGTSAHGHVYPGATVPFGMVQLSPDTRIETWDGCSGYHYSDNAILGFSHTHLSGTGCGDLGDIRLTPQGDTVQTPEPGKEKVGRFLPFSHDDEMAKPGYYRVLLQDPKVQVELTATAHAGMHRYQFSGDQPVHLVLDLIRAVKANPLEGALSVESNTVLSGYRRSQGWSKTIKVFYFVAEFSRPFDSCDLEVDGELLHGQSQGKGIRVEAHPKFAEAKRPILVKVGLSPTSVENARQNLAAEIPGWDFEATVAAAEKQWSQALGKIAIETPDAATRETFYTALYHTCMAPTLFSDVDGSYRGLDGLNHPAEGFTNYATFSLWDTFRTEHTLLTLVQPQRVDDFVGSMLAHYRQFNQHALPVWSFAGVETWCMIGNHSIPVIAESYAKGFRRYDAEAVFQAMRDTSMQDRNLLGEYRQHGFIPSGEHKQAVSRTLEYALDDWCVAHMAQLMGKTEDAALFGKRAQNYRNVFDPATGFMRAKSVAGQWRTPFDPCEVHSDYTEATAWNYTWFVPQDVPDLVALMGGDQPFVAKLDRLFTEDSKILTTIPDITGLIGQYVHGNEPCHHVAYLYCYAGAPWKTQERVRQVMTALYNNTVEGICGNDDCGQTSAWYVMSALGLYPVNPASCVYVIGSPLVNKATIQLDPQYYPGKTFTVVAKDNSPKNVYVQSATLNGRPLSRCWLSHAELVAGGELVLQMGPEKNAAWGSAPADRPPAVAAGK